MKNLNLKKILLVLASVFTVSLMFISCKEHKCSVVCPPCDHSSGFIKKYDDIIFEIYPFLKHYHTGIWLETQYDVWDSIPVVRSQFSRRADPLYIYYDSDDSIRVPILSITNIRQGVFFQRDSSLVLYIMGPFIGSADDPIIGLHFPQYRYYAGKKWEVSFNPSSPIPNLIITSKREILSIDEVVTTEAGNFENVIVVREEFFSTPTGGMVTPHIYYYYFNNDIGFIKGRTYSFVHLYDEYRLERTLELIEKEDY